ncbi:MAG TPA: LPS assembly protein LptD [Alphaproteobacteria bacterium]|nr:LPS assembly protein LptD [Alphaproteobacteria bacterium]
MKLIKPAFLFFLIPSASIAGQLVDIESAKTISAPKIEYNIKSEAIKTTGQTEIKNTSGQKMTLTDSYISNKGQDTSGNNIEIWLDDNVHVTAEKVTRKDGDTISENATFTACYKCDSFGNAWEISSSMMTHSTNNKIITFDYPVFWVYKVPVAWLPFFDMPDPTVKHKSGLLIPDLNSTNNMGTQFNIPLYLSFSEKHDATLKFSYLTNENPLFQVEHRLNGNYSEFRTSGSYTNNKEGLNRWHAFNKDVIEMGDHVRTILFLQRASDKTYLQKYGFYRDQPYLDSGGKVEVFGHSGYAVADTHVFQELRTASGKYLAPNGDILPNIRGVYQTDPLFEQTYLRLNTDVLGVSGSGVSSQRVIGESSIVSPWTMWGGNRVTANLSARYDVYNFSNTEMIDGTNFTGVKSRFLPSGYLEWGLPLARSGEDWTQIIEPRARITTMKNLDDSAFALNNDSAGALLSDATLFSDNRFSGLDLWENGTFSDYGVRFATFDNNGQNIETFLGQTYDFTKRIDTDPNSGFHNGQSDYVGRIGYENTDWLQFSTRFRLAQDTFSLRHIENSARIGSSRNYFDVGHIWAAQFLDAHTMDKNINEVSGGFGIQMTDRVGIKFNAIYNITDSKFQRHTGGIVYTHPCYFLSLEYRRDNAVKEDYVGNTTIQFRFGLNIGGMRL